MKKAAVLLLAFLFSGCSTHYILMDEDNHRSGQTYYDDQYKSDNAQYGYNVSVEHPRVVSNVTASDVFVVEEGVDYVTYQYRSVAVDEVSPLATMYCADVGQGRSPYLREVVMFHNGFMRATFDCVNLAI